MSAALERMRAALRPHHDRIEQAVNLMDPAITRQHYVAFLARTFGFIEPCEVALRAASGPRPFDLHERWKTTLLRENLAAVGMGAAAIAELPRATDLPRLDSWPAALGYLYVIEGSTPGGQVLLRGLVPRLSLSRSESVFLRSYERQVGEMWKTFLATLDTALSASATDELAIVATARATFVRLEAWHRGHRGPAALRRIAT